MQEKTYIYDEKRFIRDVIFTGWFCVAILIGSIWSVFRGTTPALMVLVAIVALYVVWNTFAARAYPRKVAFVGDRIAFSSFGRTDEYEIDAISQFSVREFPYTLKTYVRVNGGGFLRGRYWVRGDRFNDGKELFKRICDLECQINPHGLKAHARGFVAKDEPMSDATHETRDGT
jgi:hypothetical protein